MARRGLTQGEEKQAWPGGKGAAGLFGLKKRAPLRRPSILRQAARNGLALRLLGTRPAAKRRGTEEAVLRAAACELCLKYLDPFHQRDQRRANNNAA